MKKILAVAALFVSLGLVGCNPIDAAIDCSAICTRYQTCFDTSYDTGQCAASCRSRSTTDSDYRHKADQCNACIDDRTCATATFSCAVPCNSVVP